MSSPILPVVLTAVDVVGEDKENHAPREVIDLTGDSDEEKIPDRAEDSGCLIPIEDEENGWPIPVPPSHLLLPKDSPTSPPQVSDVYVRLVPSNPAPLLMPFHKSCEGSGTRIRNRE